MRQLLAAILIGLAGSACSASGDGELTQGDESETASPLEARTLTLRPDVVLAPSFAGFGAQYNQNVFADVSKQDGVTEQNVGALEAKLDRLQPRYVRIFFDSGASADERASFVRTVSMAQRTGATINVTYWHGPYQDPSAQMKAFAQAIHGLFTKSGPPSSLDVTIQNEVNTTPCVTQELYAQLYVALDGELRSVGDRAKVRFIGGDLLRGGISDDSPAAFSARLDRCKKECGWTTSACADKSQSNATTQEAWLNDFATRAVVGVPGASVLGDMFDGYSAHVYWDYWDRTKMVTRLDGIRAAVDALPARLRKPIYVTELGARGDVSAVTSPGLFSAEHRATDADGYAFLASPGYPMADTYVEAFQTARFFVEALKRGVVAAARWDAYDAHYHPDAGGNFSILKQASTGWAATPSYGVLQLVGESSLRGWSIVGVDGDAREGLIAAGLASGGGGRTIYVVDDTSAPQKLTLKGLPKSTAVRVLEWSRSEGTSRRARTEKTNATGSIVVTVPLHSIVAVTTLGT